MSRRLLLGLIAAVLVAAACIQNTTTLTRFGRNNPQYDRFEFKILTTDHFDVYFYEEEAEVAREVGRMAERWYARLSRLLNHELRGRQVVVLYASHPHFQQTRTLGRAPGEGVGGATEVFKRRIVMPLAGPLRETDHVFGHELVHAFQFDMTGAGGTVTSTSYPSAIRLPLWFIEGMAEYVSVGATDPHTTMWIRDAAYHDRLPTMRQLDNPRYFPYRFGQAFWAYIAGRFGDQVVGRILNEAARGRGAARALEQVLGIPADSLNVEWHEAIRDAYGGLATTADSLDALGTVILSRNDGSVLNSSPALNPDGSEIVFISYRDRGIDLYRADATTGDVRSKLVETAFDPHFGGLQFIQSAGAWNRKGTQFVFGSIHESDPALVFVDVADGTVAHRRVFPALGEIINPSWSPDGRYVAFSAIVGGASDLYVYELQTDVVRRITDDLYADLQPSWSPDGTRLAFTTDRFVTDLRRLAYGSYQLAVWDMAADTIEPLPAFPRGKHLNPQWSVDGASVYFLSDRTGVTNVYRTEVGTGRRYQITDLYTGVTGITGLSPALSSAAAANKIAFSVYQRGGYSIVIIDDPERLSGRPVS